MSKSRTRSAVAPLEPVWGEPLSPGARVALVAPSSWFEPAAFEAGVAALRALGLEPVYDPAVLSRQERYTAGSVADRVEELRRALHDPSIRALWAIRGGYGCMQLLPHLPLATVRAAGKPLIGFSDIVALHALWHAAGVGSVHGPNLTTLARSDATAVTALNAFLFRAERPVALRGAGGAGVGPVRGRLVGGNLALVAALAGTPYQFVTAGAVLFLEDVGERPYRLDRMLTQLALAGVLDGLRGVALGDFSGCEPLPADGSGYAGADVARDFFVARGLPCVFGLPFGHGARLEPLFYGDEVVLDPSAATLASSPLATRPV